MTAYSIPLITGAQRFSVPLGEKTYRLSLLWRGDGGWVMDIDDAGGAALAHGIPLVTGTDLLGQYRHLGIPGRLYMMTDGAPDAVPTYQSLGNGSKLYFVSDS